MTGLAAAGGCRGADARRRSGRAAPGDGHDTSAAAPRICTGAPARSRGSAAGRGLHRRPVRSHRRRSARSRRWRPARSTSAISFVGSTSSQMDARRADHLLAGVHPGCFELFGTDRVRRFSDLKGKRVAVIGLGSSPHCSSSSMLAYVGLDPRKDIDWVTRPARSRWSSSRGQDRRSSWASRPSRRSCAPGDRSRRRQQRVGPPWSQYFCCMLAANRTSSASIR